MVCRPQYPEGVYDVFLTIGPIYSLNLGGQTAIVLNSYRVASEILDKRSAIYSDRPRMIMTSEILCGNLFFPFNRYGDS